MIHTPSLRVNSFLQKNLSRSGYQSSFTRDACTKMSALALSCAAERCYLKGLPPGFLRRKVRSPHRKLLEVPAELVETALNLELEGGAVIADDLEGGRCVFLAGLYRAERGIAGKLNALP